MAALSKSQDKVARLLQEGLTLHQAGNLEGAEAAYRKALKARSREPDALNLLGVVRIQRGDPRDGVACIKQALSVRDDFPDAHLNVALALWQHLGDTQSAERHLRRALHYNATPQTYCHLGNLLSALGRGEEALAAYRGARDCAPTNPDGHIMYARALRMTNDPQAMLAAAEDGLKLAPEHPTLQIIASEAYFALGRLREGWRAYRWRFKSLENRAPSKHYPIPSWAGESLSGRSILIWTEQGIGDEVMHANMFGEIVSTSARCIIQCSPRLAPIFRRSFPAAEIMDRDLRQEELHGLDFQASAGNLGEWLRPAFDAFPRRAAYLVADGAHRDRLRERYRAAAPDSLLVGISWRSVNAESGAKKTVNLLDWGPILQVPGVTFVNLQYGDCAAELDVARRGFGARIICDQSVDPLRDLDAFAAQVAAMDVVVTSSNTAAHFSGALGVRTYCMLPKALGLGRRWYWFSEHSSCPWYPSLRRFNQLREGEWLDVIRDVGLSLVDDAAARGAAVAPHLAAMAKAFADLGRADDAQAYYFRLAQEEGLRALALTSIAALRTTALDADGAIHALDEAIAADPTYWPAYNAKGSLLGRLNRFEEAIAVYQAGLSRKDDSPELHNNLGTALINLGRSREALHHYQEARRHGANLDQATQDSLALNHAAALDSLGRMDEALSILDDLILRNPDYIDARYNRARALLSMGRLQEGWSEYAWRLRRPEANVRHEAFAIPRWDGATLAGKRILIWTEQGIGDEILTASMVPDALAAAQHVTLLCSARLVPLFRRSFPAATVEERKEPLPRSARDPKISFQMSTAELGRAFRPDLRSFPTRTRFLTADAGRTRTLRRRYESARPGAPLVGISWSSRGNLEMGWLKSNNLAAWKPILQTPGVTFVNLQYGNCADELARVRELWGVDISSDAEIDPLRDMDAFAAQVAAMDLVISTSNSAVHTSGGLGVPTWVLAPEGRGRHWYWFRDRDDSPWYPSLRFVRSLSDGSWEGAIARCAEELSAWVNSHGKNGKT